MFVPLYCLFYQERPGKTSELELDLLANEVQMMQTLPQCTEEGRAALSQHDHLRRNIRRHRQNRPNALPVPRTVEELEIPDEEALSLSGQ